MVGLAGVFVVGWVAGWVVLRLGLVATLSSGALLREGTALVCPLFGAQPFPWCCTFDYAVNRYSTTHALPPPTLPHARAPLSRTPPPPPPPRSHRAEVHLDGRWMHASPLLGSMDAPHTVEEAATQPVSAFDFLARTLALEGGAWGGILHP